MVAATTLQKREATPTQAERVREGRTYAPYVDIIENHEKLMILADMPGVRPEDLDINYERGELTIHGRVQPRQDWEKTDSLLREYGVGDFYRVFQIGEGIDADQIEAEFNQGVLTVHLPKSAQFKPRRIEVKAT